MLAGTKEIHFEAAIERDLTGVRYLQGDPQPFDATLALTPGDHFAFVEATQPDLWATLKKHPPGLEPGLLDDGQSVYPSSRGPAEWP